MLPEIERGRVPTSLPDSPSRQRFCRVRKFWLWIFPKFILIVMTQMEGGPLMSARDNLGRSLIPLCLMKAVTASPISFWPCLWRFRRNLRHQDPWSDALWCQCPALRTVIRPPPIFRVQPCCRSCRMTIWARIFECISTTVENVEGQTVNARVSGQLRISVHCS